MTTETIYEFFKILEKDNISFTYRGSFSNSVLAMATELIKNNMEEEHSKLRNKLSFLMIESFQNIARYADSDRIPEPSEESDFFMTRNIGSSFYIISANLVANDKVPFVREKLEKVNTSDKKELNELYKTILTNKQINEKGGAGLGFIEMVRKTQGKLPFDFVKINDEKSLFFMQIKLSQESEEAQKEEKIVELSDAKEIHRLVGRESILMMHKGSFSQEAVGPVLRMVEDNMHSMKLKLQKKVFHFLVEILQNISKHSFVIENDREGIFLIGLKEGKFNIGTGNYISNDKIEQLKKQIDQVNNLSNEELSELYRKFLREGRVTDSGSAGLGLIDLARETDEKINYKFIPINEQYSFFSLTVKL